VEALMNRERSSEFTTIMLEKDRIRDEEFMAFRHYVNAYTKKRTPELKAAAQAIAKIIRKHGWTLYSLGNLQESMALDLLFQDLDKPEATTAFPSRIMARAILG
jgi:hypothetical protein